MDELFSLPPYCLEEGQKDERVLPIYRELTEHHYGACGAYRRIVDCNGWHPDGSLEDVPLLPVRLFKEYDLCSVPKDDIIKTIASSGTSSQQPSKIFLDKQTAINQQKALTSIVTDFIGKARMPMLILDCPDVVKDRTKFSTRGAGILGFSVFGTKRAYALNNDMTIDYETVDEFMARFQGQRILLFGFTYIIWKHFLLELERSGRQYDFSQAVMIHGGGWKKLASEAVSKEEFRSRFKKACGLADIHENYGMAEQTGSIFMECNEGHLHASVFSKVIIRDPLTFRPCPVGQRGIIQVMSVLPHSYPGHSLLTEDEGTIEGEDDCPCGRKGEYFKIFGRLSKAELRGCSDTYAAGLER